MCIERGTELALLVRQYSKPEIQVAEVGVWEGFTTLLYGPEVKRQSGHIFLVDNFFGNVGITGIRHGYFPERADSIYNTLRKNLRSANLLDVCTVYRGNSDQMAASFPDESLDICFIDADHRYEFVKKDIQAYWPKVKLGGILAGHDLEHIDDVNTYTEEDLATDFVREVHAGVIQAVYDYFGLRGWKQIGESWMVEKTTNDLMAMKKL